MNMQAVEEYIEKNKGDLIGLLQKCIQSRPVNPLYAADHGYDEAECEKILISRLKESGVEIYTFDVELDQLEELEDIIDRQDYRSRIQKGKK